jgi:hypothetical protein
MASPCARSMMRKRRLPVGVFIAVLAAAPIGAQIQNA